MHVFTYGSLMFPAVWRRVVRGSHRALPAVLEGYARHAVRGELYPGVVHRPGASVEGVLYLDVSEAELAVLDDFEGSEYRRESVMVRTAADMQMVAADTYLFLAGHRLSGEAWERQHFRMTHFIAAHCGGTGETPA
ncbi:gamma-glutamylcyclotransferase family protein [Oxalicibacterium solurbis]|uniref:Putative gamma-glutamylcyclotransferase n=1 Tax=Oxalicibacterium solurbis TaxID=69280 RepID=A0A8J3AY07_9BURK|nr:gamma-glutamylcyclotransferase family protein [Oxalicibacterium solurbis]GGI55265.1 hypothetical protein GCM10011430_24390 [Oxalicibacterium solurbis]